MAADDISEDQGAEPAPFDVRTVRQLVTLMARHDLNEIDLQDGVRRIRLRRGLRLAAPMSVAVAPPTAAPASPVAASPAAPAPAAKPARNVLPIKSPGVGTFYLSPKPGAEPFLRVGTRVAPTTTIGLLEAMKIFNEVPAECSGVVVEVLVGDKQAVEFGQVLFHVDPAG